jgi:hypothetical protein
VDDLERLSDAAIEFSLDPLPGELNTGSGEPIDVAGTTHRALMLGLKPERSYVYRLRTSASRTVCTSAGHTLTTGPVSDVPQTEAVSARWLASRWTG